VESIVVGGVAVLAPIGEIDANTAPLLSEAVTRLREHACRLVVELGAVSFMDSTGLKVLLEAYRDLGRNPEALVLRSPTRAVAKLLRITGIDSVLTVEYDELERGAATRPTTGPDAPR